MLLVCCIIIKSIYCNYQFKKNVNKKEEEINNINIVK